MLKKGKIMLKKLAKYGNSNAIVLDKAILELLNIHEGATVKLTTDGKSLIITPVSSALDEKVNETLTFDKAVHKSIFNSLNLKLPASHQEAIALLKSHKGYEQDSFKSMSENFAEVFAKYPDIHNKMDLMFCNSEFIHESQLLAEKHSNKHSKEFLQESSKLMYKYLPELEQVHQDILLITKK